MARLSPSPQASYCIAPEQGEQITEFRDMVKALHKAGIEVILDVVFNHTGEGNHLGPTISFKGLENDFILVCGLTGLDETQLDRARIYVAMSRARVGLWVAVPAGNNSPRSEYTARTILSAGSILI